jgi:hypothetical protein
MRSVAPTISPAVVDLGDDAVGPMRPVGGDRQAGPLDRRVTPRDVGQHIAVAVLVLAGHDDAGLVGCSPDVTAGSMATTTRVICGAERSRLASIEPCNHSAPGVSSSSSASSSCRPSRVPWCFSLARRYEVPIMHDAILARSGQSGQSVSPCSRSLVRRSARGTNAGACRCSRMS